MAGDASLVEKRLDVVDVARSRALRVSGRSLAFVFAGGCILRRAGGREGCHHAHKPKECDSNAHAPDAASDDPVRYGQGLSWRTPASGWPMPRVRLFADVRGIFVVTALL